MNKLPTDFTLLVLDPLMSSLQRVEEIFDEIEDLIDSPELNALPTDAEYQRHEDQLLMVTEETSRFSDFIEACTDPYDGEIGVERFVDTRQDFTEIVEAAVAHLQSMNKTYGEIYDEPVAPKILELQNTIQSITATVAKLTPSHIALQGHFQNFLINGPKSNWTGRGVRDRLFAPAMLLRDEYFVAPRRGLLSEYLTLTEKIMTTEPYKSSSQSAMWANTAVNYAREAERYAAELEVLAMLEQTTEEPING